MASWITILIAIVLAIIAIILLASLVMSLAGPSGPATPPVGPLQYFYIYGYNFTDDTNRAASSNTFEYDCLTGSLLDNQLSGGDCLSIYIVNNGTETYTIDSFILRGETYTFQPGAHLSTLNDGEFTLKDPTQSGIPGTDIAPSIELDLIAIYNNVTTGNIPMGDSIAIEVTTTTPGVSDSETAINGLAVGE